MRLKCAAIYVAVSLAAMAATDTAFAQSSVTLYGVLDNGVAYNSNAGGKSLFSAAAKHAPQFWGLTGREDLGGGTYAVFGYSNYIYINSGGASPQTSYVGLDDTKFGRITLGRQFDFLNDVVPFTSERYMSVTGVHPGDYDRTAGLTMTNMVMYQSPAFGGLQASLLYSFANKSSDTNQGRAVGGKLTFTSGGLEAIAVYEAVNGVVVTPATDLGIPSLYGITFDPALNQAITQNEKILALGVAYNVNGWRFMGNYTNTRLSANADTETMQVWDVGFYKYIRPDLRAGLGYSYTKLASYNWNIVHAHLDYLLSKRTDVYLRAAFERAGTGQKAVLFLEPPSSNTRQLVVGVGVTHVF